MKKRLVFLTMAGIAGVMLIMGCAKPRPFEYHPSTEIPEGPGLLSGEKGEFTIYDSKKRRETNDAGRDRTPAAQESDTFRQFQQWRKDQAEFKAFQEWKRSQQGSQEYEEFQEWKRWKEYQRWTEEQRKSN